MLVFGRGTGQRVRIRSNNVQGSPTNVYPLDFQLLNSLNSSATDAIIKTTANVILWETGHTNTKKNGVCFVNIYTPPEIISVTCPSSNTECLLSMVVGRMGLESPQSHTQWGER